MSKLIETALIEYGIAEIAGPKHSQDILAFFADIGHSWVKDDETAWCAAFANWVLKQCGIKGTGKLNARSFLTLGTPTTEPKMGDVVVLWRGTKVSAEGHVGFYVTSRNGQIYILGGNQGDKVCISAFPTTQLLGFRRIEKQESDVKIIGLKDFTLKEIGQELILRS